MRVKKILVVLTMLMISLIPLNVSASEITPQGAGWQHVGSEGYYYIANKNHRTGSYYAFDGNNFKIEVYAGTPSGSFNASMFVNGIYRSSTGTVFSNGRATLQFSGLNPGDIVYFDVLSGYTDDIDLDFYD